jgi:hypothetical protein
VRAVLYFLLASLMAPSAAAAVCVARCTHVEHLQAPVTSSAACHDAAPRNEAPDLAVSGGEACHDEAGRFDARLADRLAAPAPALAPLARHLSDAAARPDANTCTPRPPRIFLITQLRI